MPRVIGVVSVARSDWGHLVPVLEAMRGAADLDVRLLVGGAHLSARFGSTVTAIEAAGWPIAARVEMLGTGDAPVDMATAAGRSVTGFAEVFARQRLDLLLVLATGSRCWRRVAASLRAAVATKWGEVPRRH